MRSVKSFSHPYPSSGSAATDGLPESVSAITPRAMREILEGKVSLEEVEKLPYLLKVAPAPQPAQAPTPNIKMSIVLMEEAGEEKAGKEVQAAYEERRKPLTAEIKKLQDDKKKVVITGSNAALLSREFGTRLTGRYKSFEVYPFSFREYLLFKNINYKKDWFYIACALRENTAIWSNDKKLKVQDKIKVYNTHELSKLSGHT